MNLAIGLLTASEVRLNVTNAGPPTSNEISARQSVEFRPVIVAWASPATWLSLTRSVAASLVSADCGWAGSVVVTRSGPLPSGAISTEVMSKRSRMLMISGVQSGADILTSASVSRPAELSANSDCPSALNAIGREGAPVGHGDLADARPGWLVQPRMPPGAGTVASADGNGLRPGRQPPGCLAAWRLPLRDDGACGRHGLKP